MLEENFQSYIEILKHNVDQYIKNAKKGQANDDQRNSLLEECKKAFDACNLRYNEIKKNFIAFYQLNKTIHSQNDALPHISKIQEIISGYGILGNASLLLDIFKKLDVTLSHEDIQKIEPLQNEIYCLRRKMRASLPEFKELFDECDQTLEVDEFFDAEEGYTELEKEAKIEFSQYIKSGSIDSVSIEEISSGNLHAKITLRDSNTDVKISELLNNEFCKSNKITSFSLLHSNKEEIISGYVDEEKVRCYDLSKIAPHQMQFNWCIGERECSITLSTNGNRVVVTGCKGLHSMKDLEANNYVKIKIGDDYLSLTDTVISTQLKQPAPQGAQQHNRESSIAV